MRENKWKTLSSKESYATPYFTVHEDDVIRPDGTAGKYYVIEQKSAIMIVAVNNDNETYLIGQHRYTTNMFSWEIPGGGYEGGDELEEAKRELLEETGLVSDQWEKLGTFQTMNGQANHLAEVFLARDVQQTADNKQSEEGISEMLKESFTRIFEMIRSGELMDAESITSLTMAALRLGII
jgi:8-oxo-dGTP pyrophosphatase MutT (NUDIX family)